MLLHFSTALGAALGVLLVPGNPAAAADGGLRPLAAAPDQPPLRFGRFDEARGGPINNPNGVELGRLENLVIDRGSGDIRYLVLDRGGILDGVGAGGKFARHSLEPHLGRNRR